MEGNHGRREKQDDQQREERFKFEEKHGWGSWWPSRNYACSFCKREFRSAQALGGHMNVHRRDRARLRSGMPLWLNPPDHQSPKPSPNPIITTTNPNPNPTPSSSHHHDPFIHNYSSHHHPRHSHHPNALALPSSPSFRSTSTEHNQPMLITSSKLPLFTHQSRSEIKINYEDNLKGGCTTTTCAKDEKGKGFKNNKHDSSTTNNNIALELELGLGLLQHPKEQIDLELRLGHF